METGRNGPHDRELRVALAAVAEAARLCLSVQRRLEAQVLAKSDRSPVTVADFGSQALICRSLHEAFPADPIMAEEDAAALRAPEQAAILAQVAADVAALRPGLDGPAICDLIDRGRVREARPRFWALDPIDGTKGFLRGGQYAIALALVVAGQVELGVLGCPRLVADGEEGWLLFARRGQGSFTLPLGPEPSPEQARPLRVSPTGDVREARLCESVEAAHTAHGEAADLAERLAIRPPPLRLDSQAKYALLARGDAELYLRLPTRADYQERLWDHAAGALIVTEAGGQVTDIAGRPLDWSRGAELSANRGVVASNGPIHAAVLAALAGTKMAGNRT